MFAATMPIATNHIGWSIVLIVVISCIVAGIIASVADEEDWGPASPITLGLIAFVVTAIIGTILSIMLYNFAWADYYRTLTDTIGK